jgi:methylated-DNA-protein-cysteine methyltransferase-like protein
MSAYDLYYEVVRRVPRGRVVTYGAVAREAGRPGSARQVGYALAALREGQDVPWHRVVNARGEVSRRSAGLGVEQLQRAKLESEGVAFDERDRIDLGQFGWP